MKRNIIRLIVAALLLVACGSTPVLAGGPGQPPLCYPGDVGCPNVAHTLFDGGGEPPLCVPGSPACPR